MKRQYTRVFYKKNHINFIATNLILIFDAILTIGIAFILQQIMDIAAYGNTRQLMEIILFTAVYLAICCINGMLERRFRNAFIQRAVVQFKEMIFKKLSNKNVNSFSNDSTGRYISSFTNDITSIEQNYLDRIFSLITNTLVFIGATLMMLWYNWQLTAISFLMCLISMIISMATGKGIAANEKDVSVKNESFVVTIKEILTGFSVIKSFKAEKETENLFKDKNISLEYSKCAKRKKGKLIFLISNALGVLSQVVIMAYGAYITITGDITVGVLVAFIQLMNNVIYPVQNIPSDVSNINAAKAVIKKISELFETDCTKTGTEIPDHNDTNIVFKNVTFSYSEEKTILDNISYKFQKGKSYAIVGSSGCGKSTLLRLIMGCCNNYSGKVMLGNTELRDIKPDCLYDFVTAVQQETFIFDSTLENNITMFKYFKRNDVDRVIDMAGLRNFIDQKGSSFLCGENGNNLSGGEKQRLSIARGLLRGTPILLMDEITSALDNKTAYEIESAILNLGDFTRIVVTHKLNENVIRSYDEILVLKNGKIIESGNFDALINAHGYFYSLYNISKADS